MSEKESGEKKDGKSPKTGVILMTYGSATTAERVREYFENMYKNNAGSHTVKPSESLIKDFENRYRLVGRSPLVEITMQQADLLEKKFQLSEKSGDAAKKYIVRAGMRHSAPKIADAIGECRAAGATRLVGIVLSPQFSLVIMEGYRRAFSNAAKEQGFAEGAATIAGPWSTEPHFIELLANRVKDSLSDLAKKYHTPVPIIFTTHSLPQSVVAKDPSYIDQLKATTDAVLAELPKSGVISETIPQHYSAYQSAGHTPEAWLKPDLTDVLDELSELSRGIATEKIRKTKTKPPAVLIVPIQFLADHLEILYDLDIAARKQCENRGIAYHRIKLPNTDPLFIAALEAVVLATV